MSQSVTIKSNKYGINLVLDPEIGFDELLKDVVEKFKASSTFFKNAKLALSFEGRKLSEEEEQQIISAIESNTSFEILCIVENGTRQEAVMKEQVEAFFSDDGSHKNYHMPVFVRRNERNTIAGRTGFFKSFK